MKELFQFFSAPSVSFKERRMVKAAGGPEHMGSEPKKPAAPETTQKGPDDAKKVAAGIIGKIDFGKLDLPKAKDLTADKGPDLAKASVGQTASPDKYADVTFDTLAAARNKGVPGDTTANRMAREAQIGSGLRQMGARIDQADQYARAAESLRDSAVRSRLRAKLESMTSSIFQQAGVKGESLVGEAMNLIKNSIDNPDFKKNWTDFALAFARSEGQEQAAYKLLNALGTKNIGLPGNVRLALMNLGDKKGPTAVAQRTTDDE